METSREIATGMAEMPALLFVVCQSLSSELRVTTCMPIKFRCEKCRQFLGISRAQAGQVVDCPTCGRATRVPNLDGHREPLPNQPALDKADSSLLNALDQLADLGKKAPIPDKRPADREAGRSVESEPVEAVELPEPITLEPREPSAVLDPPGSDISTPGGGSTGGVDSAVVLENLAAESPPAEVVDPTPQSRVPFLVSGILAAVILFGGGWFSGRLGTDSRAMQTETEKAREEPATEESRRVASGITGRITYRKPESECMPDRGARVIAWPVETVQNDKWTADGFRAGASDQLTDVARKYLVASGGNLAVVDDAGLFHLPLSSGGDYEVLILSRFGGRAFDSQGLSSAEAARLAVCFSDPGKLVGKTQYRLIRMKYRGQGPQLLDNVFEVGD